MKVLGVTCVAIAFSVLFSGAVLPGAQVAPDDGIPSVKHGFEV